MNSFDAVVYIFWLGGQQIHTIYRLINGVVERGNLSSRESQRLYSAARVLADIYSPELDVRICEIAQAYKQSQEARRFRKLVDRAISPKLSRCGTGKALATQARARPLAVHLGRATTACIRP